MLDSLPGRGGAWPNSNKWMRIWDAFLQHLDTLWIWLFLVLHEDSLTSYQTHCGYWTGPLGTGCQRNKCLLLMAWYDVSRRSPRQFPTTYPLHMDFIYTSTVFFNTVFTLEQRPFMCYSEAGTATPILNSWTCASQEYCGRQVQVRTQKKSHLGNRRGLISTKDIIVELCLGSSQAQEPRIFEEDMWKGPKSCFSIVFIKLILKRSFPLLHMEHKSLFVLVKCI